MSAEVASLAPPCSTISETTISAVKLNSQASMASQVKSATNASKTLPKRAATASKAKNAAKVKAIPKRAAGTKVKKPIGEHPTYAAMIVEALKSLNEKKGSSKVAIAKHIFSQYQLEPSRVSVALGAALKRASDKGILQRMSGIGSTGRFRLAKTAKVAAKGDAAKSPAAVKAKLVAKKASATSQKKKPVGASKKSKLDKGAKKPKLDKAVKKSSAAKPKNTAAKSSKPKSTTAKKTKPAASASGKKSTAKKVSKPTAKKVVAKPKA